MHYTRISSIMQTRCLIIFTGQRWLFHSNWSHRFLCKCYIVTRASIHSPFLSVWKSKVEGQEWGGTMRIPHTHPSLCCFTWDHSEVIFHCSECSAMKQGHQQVVYFVCSTPSAATNSDKRVFHLLFRAAIEKAKVKEIQSHKVLGKL